MAFRLVSVVPPKFTLFEKYPVMATLPGPSTAMP
jgi:hypothetical protein